MLFYSLEPLVEYRNDQLVEKSEGKIKQARLKNLCLRSLFESHHLAMLLFFSAYIIIFHSDLFPFRESIFGTRIL